MVVYIVYLYAWHINDSCYYLPNLTLISFWESCELRAFCSELNTDIWLDSLAQIGTVYYHQSLLFWMQIL